MELLSPRMIKFFGVEEHRGAKELLEYNLRKLRMLGVWKWDVSQWIYHRAFAFLTIIALTLFALSQLFEAYFNITNIDHLTKLLVAEVFVCLLIFKNIYLLTRNDYVYDLIDQLQNRFFTNKRPPTSQQTTILNRYAARAKLYTVVRSNFVLGIITFWLLYPIKELIEELTENMSFPEDDNANSGNNTIVLELPFVAYHPYDVENNITNYIFTYLFQVFCGYSVFIGMPAFDMLFVSVFIHLSGHFKALQYVLFNLHEEAEALILPDKNQPRNNRLSTIVESPDAQISFRNKGCDSSQDVEGESYYCDRKQNGLCDRQLDEGMQIILINCIQHHQAILSFVEGLEDFLQPVMLMQLLASCVAFIVIGFQMSLIPIQTEGTKFIKLSVSLVTALVEQGMFYWFAGELLEESVNTLSAAYHCKWYITNKTFRQDLLLLMERAKRQVKLTAGGFSTLTLQNFASVIQSSYSYFTMLKAVHNK